MATRRGQRQPADSDAGADRRRPSGGGLDSRAALDSRIDRLYQLPLSEFTTARNALAKSLAADGARDLAAWVRGLEKPTILPWAVNQVYWQARSVWDRLVAAGDALREAQIAALEHPGRSPTAAQQLRERLRVTTDAHRQALADAVHQAVRASTHANVHPQADLISRMLEAISLASTRADTPGRLTDVVQPAGFEALLGVTPGPPLPSPSAGGPAIIDRRPARGTRASSKASAARAADERERRAVEAARQRQVRIETSTAVLARATAAEQAAQEAEVRAAESVADAELRLTQARAALATARSTSRDARAAREKAEAAIRQAQDA